MKDIGSEKAWKQRMLTQKNKGIFSLGPVLHMNQSETADQPKEKKTMASTDCLCIGE